MGIFLKNWKFSQIFSLEKSPKCPKFFVQETTQFVQKKIIASHVLEKGIRGVILFLGMRIWAENKHTPSCDLPVNKIKYRHNLNMSRLETHYLTNL
jgi:hypothetical protein